VGVAQLVEAAPSADLQPQRGVSIRERIAQTEIDLRLFGMLVALIVILIIVVFIIPNPTGAGTFIGNTVDSIVTFFRSIGASLNTV
jgi:hypothetical protein